MVLWQSFSDAEAGPTLANPVSLVAAYLSDVTTMSLYRWRMLVVASWCNRYSAYAVSVQCVAAVGGPDSGSADAAIRPKLPCHLIS